jgi:hypothetical protein
LRGVAKWDGVKLFQESLGLIVKEKGFGEKRGKVGGEIKTARAGITPRQVRKGHLPHQPLSRSVLNLASPTLFILRGRG